MFNNTDLLLWWLSLVALSGLSLVLCLSLVSLCSLWYLVSLLSLFIVSLYGLSQALCLSLVSPWALLSLSLLFLSLRSHYGLSCPDPSLWSLFLVPFWSPSLFGLSMWSLSSVSLCGLSLVSLRSLFDPWSITLYSLSAILLG